MNRRWALAAVVFLAGGLAFVMVRSTPRDVVPPAPALTPSPATASSPPSMTPTTPGSAPERGQPAGTPSVDGPDGGSAPELPEVRPGPQLLRACADAEKACSTRVLWTPTEFEARPLVGLTKAGIASTTTDGVRVATDSPFNRCVSQALTQVSLTDQPLATERAAARCPPFQYRLSVFSEFDAQALVRTCFGSRAQTAPVSLEYDWHVVGRRVEVEGVVVTGDGVDESIRRCIELAMRATGRDFKEEDRPSFERFHLSSKVRPPRVQRALRLRLSELIEDIDAGVRPPTDDDLEALRQATVDFPQKAINWRMLGFQLARHAGATANPLEVEAARQAFQRYVTHPEAPADDVALVKALLDGGALTP
ncbi:MAG: hypothetical protein Q8N26_27680 [Myxococcales bacterium]|nr:hypothetical protein [Myxococcales bacterium]